MTRTPLTGVLALALLLLGLLLNLMLAGCGGDTSAREDSEQQRQRPRAEATADAAPSATPHPTPRQKPRAEVPAEVPAPERRSTASTPAPAPTGNALTIQQTPSSHLIGAGALGANWSVEATRAEAGRMTSECQRASFRDIGAMETRVRDFAADRSAAVQAVSRFGDAKSAWRAEQVMIAWREDCADQLRRREAALGTVRHGTWLSVVEVAGSPHPRQRLRTALAAVEATF